MLWLKIAKLIYILIFKSFLFSISLSDISDFANVVIALVSLLLAYYIFVYQREKDQSDNIKAGELNEQNIRLQWFKELIIQPNFQYVISFYHNLDTLKDRIGQANLNSDSDIIALIDFVKEESSLVHNHFVIALQGVTPSLFLDVKDNLDSLCDELTAVIGNTPLSLRNPQFYAREIELRILDSRNNLLTLIYKYRRF